MGDNIHDDIRTAMESAKETPPAGTPPPTENNDFAPQKSEILPPVQPDNKDILPKQPASAEPPKEGDQQRGPDGKFLPRQPVPPVQQVQPTQPAAPVAQTPPVPGAVQFDPAKPPASWTQPMKDKWATIPEDVRTEITRREEATANGVQKLMQHYAPMEQIFNVVAPFEGYFEHIQEDPRGYLHSMITMEQTLRLGNPAQKIELLLAVADTYGVPIRSALNEAMGGKLADVMAEAHAHHKTPPSIPPAVQQELMAQRQWRTQVEDAAAEGELAQFAATPGHEYLEHVRDDMADLIERGAAEGYQDAYDLACFRNPQIRASIQAQQNGTAQQNGVQQRQAAAAALVTPPPAPLVVGGEQPKEEDDLYETVRKQWNAAATGRAV